MNTITKEELLKILLKTENQNLKNIINYDDIKIKLNKDEKKNIYYWINNYTKN
jgi:hypothetical protein